MLTPGNVSDVTVAPELLANVQGARYVLADKGEVIQGAAMPKAWWMDHAGYDADALRRTVRRAGAVPVIPGRITRKRRISRQQALPRPAPDRERVLPPQGLPADPHPL